MKFLCPVVSREMGKGKVVLHEDFTMFKKQVVAREKDFVREFYDGLRSSGNEMKTVLKKYRYQMARYFAETADKQIHNKNHSTEMFLPCSFDEFLANGYTVDYMGEDCFKVTAGGKSLYLKVVLYGNKLTPAIMGMKNPSQDTDYCPDRFPWPESIKAQ